MMATITEYVCDYIPSILVCSTTFLCLLWFLRQQSNLPPGPWSVPLLGTLPYLVFTMCRSSMKPWQIFQTLALKYGDVFSFNALGYVVIVLNSYDTIKEAFQNPLLNDRPHYTMFVKNLEPGRTIHRGDSAGEEQCSASNFVQVVMWAIVVRPQATI